MANQSEIIQLISIATEQYNKTLTDAQFTLYTGSLKNYSLSQLKLALDAHITDSKEGMFFPMPAHIIKHINIDDGRPSADEAWLNTPSSEAESISWTRETREAYFEVTNNITHGDEFTKRQAFKSCYDRYVSASRKRGMVVKWETTLGDDKLSRDEAIENTRMKNAENTAYNTSQLPAPKKVESLEFYSKEVNTKENKLEGIDQLKSIMDELDIKIGEDKKENTALSNSRAKKTTEFFNKYCETET